MRQKIAIRNKIGLTFLFITGLFTQINAQTFEEARNYAFNGERGKARSICKKILSEGFNSDVALLMGRTYAWDGNYDSARIVLNSVLIHKPGNMEAYDALSDVEFWSDNNMKAVEYCDMAIQNDSTAHSFVLKKARILYSAEKYEDAVDVLQEFLKKNPNQDDFIRKLKEYRLDLMKNKIKLSYSVDFFDEDFNRDPWQITSLSYSRKTKIGSVIARVNYGNRFGNKGFQYEIDAYPKFTENSYFYVNYGFSKNTLFPRNRYGVEWYHNFPHAFEGSVGMRLLQFSDYVDIYTATFGKYIGNYWISLRTFITPGEEGTSVSGFLLTRRYFSDPENYLGLKVAYGVSPDENRDIYDTIERLYLKKRSIRLDFNHIFNRLWIFNTGFELGSEEREPDIMSGYYTIDVSLSRLF